MFIPIHFYSYASSNSSNRSVTQCSTQSNSRHSTLFNNFTVMKSSSRDVFQRDLSGLSALSGLSKWRKPKQKTRRQISIDGQFFMDEQRVFTFHHVHYSGGCYLVRILYIYVYKYIYVIIYNIYIYIYTRGYRNPWTGSPVQHSQPAWSFTGEFAKMFFPWQLYMIYNTNIY